MAKVIFESSVTPEMSSLSLPDASGSSTFTTGSNGQVPISNGTGIYWGNINASDADTVDSYHASDFILKTGDTMTGLLNLGRQFVADAGSGTNGYIKICTVTATGAYQNIPICFGFTRRGDVFPTLVSLRFNNANNSDPGVGDCRTIGGCKTVYWTYTSGTADIYIQKTEGYDCIEIIYESWGLSPGSVVFKNEFVTSLPSGAKQADYFQQNWGSTLPSSGYRYGEVFFKT